MRVVNRLFTILITLLLLAAVPAVLIFPGETLPAARDVLANLEGDLQEVQQLILIGAAVGADLLLLLLLYANLRPRPRDSARFKLVGGGRTEMNFAPIQQRLERNIAGLRGIRYVTTVVSAQRGRVKADIDVTVAPNAVLRTLQKQILEVAQATSEDQMGLKMAGRPQLNLHLEDTTAPPPPVERPRVPEPPPGQVEHPQPPVRPPGGFTIPPPPEGSTE
ncbi:MAG: hypothetical protein ACFB51_13700, partial [Anaerolineae bacterium]